MKQTDETGRAAMADKLPGKLMAAALCVLAVLTLPASAGASPASEPRAGDTASAGAAERHDLLACATCGCSEVCPVAMMDADTKGRYSSQLSDSIWGNIILKMAYQRDGELQKLAQKLGILNAGTTGAVITLAAGSLAQSIDSMAMLNPPDGILDSYTPGIIGLSLGGVTNIFFGARMLVNHKYSRQIKLRQATIKREVEAVLERLEQSGNPSASDQDELAKLIGERAALDCVQLWQSSHATAATIRESKPPIGQSNGTRRTIDISTNYATGKQPF